MTEEQRLLLDCWMQFSSEAQKNEISRKFRWSGGLSTLEDLQKYLFDNGIINGSGYPIKS